MTSLIIATLILIAIYVGTKRLSGLQTIGVIGVLVLGIVLAIFPGFATTVALALHVGRGTDLIFYLAVLAGLFVASNFYFRFKRQEEMLVALTRQSALDHAQSPDGHATDSATPVDNEAAGTN